MVSIPQTKLQHKRSLMQITQELRYWEMASNTACDYADTHYNRFIAPRLENDLDISPKLEAEHEQLHEKYLECMSKVQALTAERDQWTMRPPTGFEKAMRWIEEHCDMEPTWTIGQQVPRGRFSKKERWCIIPDPKCGVWHLVDNGYVVATADKRTICLALNEKVRQGRKEARQAVFETCARCGEVVEFCACETRLEVL